MFERFEFPPQTQRWLAGKRLAKDADMLRTCGIRKDNDIIYLYLVSAQSVGLTRDAAEVQPRRHSKFIKVTHTVFYEGFTICHH